MICCWNLFTSLLQLIHIYCFSSVCSVKTPIDSIEKQVGQPVGLHDMASPMRETFVKAYRADKMQEMRWKKHSHLKSKWPSQSRRGSKAKLRAIVKPLTSFVSLSLPWPSRSILCEIFCPPQSPFLSLSSSRFCHERVSEWSPFSGLLCLTCWLWLLPLASEAARDSRETPLSEWGNCCMTSPAWVIMLPREMASKPNGILWMASQIGWESFNQFVALPMVCRN